MLLWASGDLLTLHAPLVSGANVTIEWVLPRDIIPRQTKVVVWSDADVTAAAAKEYTVQPGSGTKKTLTLAQGEAYMYMVVVDVIDGARLQSNPARVRVPNGE